VLRMDVYVFGDAHRFGGDKQIREAT